MSTFTLETIQAAAIIFASGCLSVLAIIFVKDYIDAKKEDDDAS